MKISFNKEKLRKLISSEPDFVASAGLPYLRDGDSLAEELDVDKFDITLLPWKEMIEREWIKGSIEQIEEHFSQYLEDFLAPIGHPEALTAHFRRTISQRTKTKMNYYSLWAWTSKILINASDQGVEGKFSKECLSAEFFRELVQLSPNDEGPLLARDFLSKHGICLVVEPHLEKTWLDGAACYLDSAIPVVGLSLRHDRVDNFWFCLIHELAHHYLHFDNEDKVFIDDLDSEKAESQIETEADIFAGDLLIPRAQWHPSRARRQRNHDAVIELAKNLNIHPGIVAGRVRRESGDYSLLPELVGQGEVRKLFA